jgi:hypothetical protein
MSRQDDGTGLACSSSAIFVVIEAEFAGLLGTVGGIRLQRSLRCFDRFTGDPG